MPTVENKRARQAFDELRTALQGVTDRETAAADGVRILAQLRTRYTDDELRVAVGALERLDQAAHLAAALKGRL
jgi:hypothetical protein